MKILKRQFSNKINLQIELQNLVVSGYQICQNKYGKYTKDSYDQRMHQNDDIDHLSYPQDRILIYKDHEYTKQFDLQINEEQLRLLKDISKNINLNVWTVQDKNYANLIVDKVKTKYFQIYDVELNVQNVQDNSYCEQSQIVDDQIKSIDYLFSKINIGTSKNNLDRFAIMESKGHRLFNDFNYGFIVPRFYRQKYEYVGGKKRIMDYKIDIVSNFIKEMYEISDNGEFQEQFVKECDTENTLKYLNRDKDSLIKHQNEIVDQNKLIVEAEQDPLKFFDHKFGRKDRRWKQMRNDLLGIDNQQLDRFEQKAITEALDDQDQQDKIDNSKSYYQEKIKEYQDRLEKRKQNTQNESDGWEINSLNKKQNKERDYSQEDELQMNDMLDKFMEKIERKNPQNVNVELSEDQFNELDRDLDELTHDSNFEDQVEDLELTKETDNQSNDDISFKIKTKLYSKLNSKL